MTATLQGRAGFQAAVDITVGLTGGTTHTSYVEDLSYGSSVNGGYDSMSGTITQDEYFANLNLYKPEMPVHVRIDEPSSAMSAFDNNVVFDGFLKQPTVTDDGQVKIEAKGGRALADDYKRQLTFAVDCFDGWGARDGDPFNAYPNSEDFRLNIDSNSGTLTWYIGREIYSLDESAAAKLWLPGVLARAVRFDMWRNGGGWDGGGFACQLYKFSAPTGSGSLVSSRGWGTAAGTVGTRYTYRDIISSPYDGVEFATRCTNAINRTGTTYKIVQARVDRVRVYDLAYVDGSASDDNWVSGGTGTRSVINKICSLIGYSTNSTINPSTTQNVLPLAWDREEPVSGLLDQLGVFEGRWWGIYERDSAGKFKLYFLPWGGGTTWYVDYSDIIGRPEPSDDVYNQAQVWWSDQHGHAQKVTVNASVDPLAGTPRALTAIPRTFTYTLSEKQPDSSLATAVANAIISDYSAPTFSGQVTLVQARNGSSTGTVTPAPLIKAGDWLNITSYPTSQRFRITGTNSTPANTTLSFGRGGSKFEQRLAQWAKYIDRHQRWGR